MSLFRVNGQPLKFDVVGLNDETYKKIEEIISKNGGEIEHNEKQPIKFTQRLKFVTYAFPASKLYDIKFIMDCVRSNTIVDPAPYRIGKSMLYDNCIMDHFLKGPRNCCVEEFTMDGVKAERMSYVESSESMMDEQCNSKAGSDRSDERSNGLDSFRKPLLQPKNNISLPEGSRTNISPSNNRHSVAALAARGDGPRSNSSNRSDVDTICVGQRSQRDKSEDSSSSLSDDDAATALESRRNSNIKNHKRGRGQKITYAEEVAIVKYLVNNRLIGEVGSGLLVWSQLIANGICANRSPNSLYRHFRKYILPRIDEFALTERQLQRFRRLRNSST